MNKAIVAAMLTGISLAAACRSIDQSQLAAAKGDGPSPTAALLFSPVGLAEFSAAVASVKELAGISGEDDMVKQLACLADPQWTTLTGEALAKAAISDEQMHKFGGQITEFGMLASTAFSYRDASFVAKNQALFDRSSAVVEKMRLQINRFVKSIHPGFSTLKATGLMANNQGKGIVIAVFDLFDKNLLARQREHYPEAHFEALKTFGDPVEMNHGNSVIDVILSLAPQASIVPFTADQATYNTAFAAISARLDIDIVNISRTLLGAKDGSLDPLFASTLDQLVQTKILTKALGNTGTDLDGSLTKLRQSLSLGPVDNLFAYDAALIQSWLQRAGASKLSGAMILLAVNLDPFGQQIALTATVPGQNPLAQGNALGAPSDGIFSFATDNFESGSSFAAPVLAGLSALLLAEEKILKPDALGPAARQRVVATLKDTARLYTLGPEDAGKGIPQGDDALKSLFHQP